MPGFPVPTRADQCEFLLRLYFGADPDRLGACVNRAYRDLNRTLHGLVGLPTATELRERARMHVRSALATLPRSAAAESQGTFDAWHRNACDVLCATYAEAGFPSFTVGQAQKWLNMAFKYVHVFGEEHLPGFGGLYAFGHVPLDNIMLRQLARYGAPRLPGPWSRLRDYKDYFGFQEWIRQHFPGAAPLAVEFHLWQESSS
jgi:hypothetical protein